METGFYFSTTSNFPGWKISRCRGVVCANVVVGTNILSDFAASLTDFFGGKSRSYGDKLEYIYREAMGDLRKKARKLGANAVIGTRVDFDEISGKDKSMFMVSVSGTACTVEVADGGGECLVRQERNVTWQADLDRELLKREIIAYVKENKRVLDKWVEFMQENPIDELLEDLINIFFMNRTYIDSPVKDTAVTLLRAYGKERLVPVVYGMADKDGEFDCASDLIHALDLFDPFRVLELCVKDHGKGTRLLDAKADIYDEKDLSTMEGICELYESLPDTGRMEKVKTGVFSKKEEEKFICENGHENETYNEFCHKCGVNIKGLNRTEAALVDKFKRKTEALRAILRGNARPT